MKNTIHELSKDIEIRLDLYKYIQNSLILQNPNSAISFGFCHYIRDYYKQCHSVTNDMIHSDDLMELHPELRFHKPPYIPKGDYWFSSNDFETRKEIINKVVKRVEDAISYMKTVKEVNPTIILTKDSIGKQFLRRDGKIITLTDNPKSQSYSKSYSNYPYKDADSNVTYTVNGTQLTNSGSDADLIKEISSSNEYTYIVSLENNVTVITDNLQELLVRLGTNKEVTITVKVKDTKSEPINQKLYVNSELIKDCHSGNFKIGDKVIVTDGSFMCFNAPPHNHVTGTYFTRKKEIPTAGTSSLFKIISEYEVLTIISINTPVKTYLNDIPGILIPTNNCVIQGNDGIKYNCSLINIKHAPTKY